MITLASYDARGVRHYRGLSTDMVAKGNCYKVERGNGDEAYTMDTQKVYMYDAENCKWRDQEDGSVV